MGFLSTIFSIGSAICSGISKVCSAIGGALSTASEAISKFASTIISKGQELFPKIPGVDLIIKVVGAVVSAIAEVLGLKEKEKDDPEELGMKAEQAEKKPEDFKSTEEYIKYLHNEISVDEEKRKKLSDEERAAYSSIGSKLYLDASAEKLGVEKGSITPEFLLDSAKLNLQGTEVVEIIKEIKTIGMQVDKVSEFLHGKTNPEESKEIRSAMTEAFSKLEPQMSKDEIAGRLNEMKQELSNI